MGQFTNGMLVGLGISLLFAPKKGEEVRRLLMERLQTMRGSAQGNQAFEPRSQPMVGSFETPSSAVPTTDYSGTVKADLGAAAAPPPSLETDVSSTTPLPKPPTGPTQFKRQP